MIRNSFNINNFESSWLNKVSSVALHLNNDNNLINDFFCLCRLMLERLYKEMFWIHLLKTFQPDGLNAKVLN